MTLLITLLSAIAVTLVWYLNGKARRLGIGTLCLAFWGASLMWLVDAVAEYIREGENYFKPAGADMLNDAFLGLAVVALGLAAWVISVIVRDPDGVVRRRLKRHE
ncbi:MAG: hypothetical protein IJR91_01580 [Ruminococcus sp.]|nr:hypothetical protein [Ruminococcus sp.]